MTITTAPAQGPGHIDEVWVCYADMAVRTGLDHYGRRLLRKLGRSIRNNDQHLKHLPPEQWHTVIPAKDIPVDELLDGALRFFDETAPLADQATAACLREALTLYLRTVIGAGMAHDRAKLANLIYEIGCLEPVAA
jgi:hypothetical protein